MQIEFEVEAEDVLAKIAPLARLFTGCFHALVHFEDFAVHVVVTGLHPHAVGGDRHAFDQHVRVVAQDVAVLAGARFAFVRVAHQIFFALVVTRHEAPLQAGREPCTAATTQARCLHFGNDRVRCHLLGQHLAQRLVAADLEIVLQRPRLVELHCIEEDGCAHCLSSSARIWSIFSLVKRPHIFLLLMVNSGASTQAPMHSPSRKPNLPSGVTSFRPMPSFLLR